MKSRITTAFVLLLYLAVATIFGVAHDHEHGGGLPDDCAACKWQLSAAGEAPLVFAVVFFASVVLSVLIPQTFCVVAEFPAATASRAPPASPA